MRTTLTIDDHLLKAAKQRAHERHLTLGQLVEDALQAELLRPASAADADTVPALPTYGDGGMRPGIDPTSNASLFGVDEDDDTARLPA